MWTEPFSLVKSWVLYCWVWSWFNGPEWETQQAHEPLGTNGYSFLFAPMLLCLRAQTRYRREHFWGYKAVHLALDPENALVSLLQIPPVSFDFSAISLWRDFPEIHPFSSPLNALWATGCLSRKHVINGLFSKAEIVPWKIQYWFFPLLSHCFNHCSFEWLSFLATTRESSKKSGL